VKLFALLRMLVRYLSVDDTFHFLLTSGITDFLLVLFVCLVQNAKIHRVYRNWKAWRRKPKPVGLLS
jgi:hypothetical protein